MVHGSSDPVWRFGFWVFAATTGWHLKCERFVRLLPHLFFQRHSSGSHGPNRKSSTYWLCSCWPWRLPGFLGHDESRRSSMSSPHAFRCLPFCKPGFCFPNAEVFQFHHHGFCLRLVAATVLFLRWRSVVERQAWVANCGGNGCGSLSRSATRESNITSSRPTGPSTDNPPTWRQGGFCLTQIWPMMYQ